MQNLKLYNYFRSSTSYRVRIALEHKKLKYDYIPINLALNGGEQNTPDYREKNPMGGVPTLEHNGQLISQSFVIIDYIDQIFNDGEKIYLKDIYLNSKIRQACEVINADTHPLHNLKVMKFLEKNYLFNEVQKQEWFDRWITEGLMAFDKTIKDFSGKYCFGDQITAADFFLAPQMFSAKRFNVDTTHLPRLNEIADRYNHLEAFQKAHPLRQPDTPEKLRIK